MPQDILSELTTHTTPGSRMNWSGNLTYSTNNLDTPQTVTDLQEIVKKSTKVRALGSRHSFNTIADSTERQVSTGGLNKIVSLDKINNTVTVEAGIRYGELCTYLDDNGYALHNLASLPHISVAGACSTATHGSGRKNGSLASAVSAIELVNGRGEIVSLSKEKHEAEFDGVVVGLGATGIVTKMSLGLQPTFRMKQLVYQHMPMAALEKNFEAVMDNGYSVSLFTDWKNKSINQVWIKSRVADDDAAASPEYHGAKLATRNLHPLEDLPAENCTDQAGVAGPWYERMPHFKMGFTPSSGKELQSEYFIAAENGYEGMMALEKLNAKIAPHLFISEIRSIAADDFWMSPFYKRTSVAFHFTWKQEWDAVRQLLPVIEEALSPFNPRPHWGKLFSMEPPVLQSRIQRLNDFKTLLAKYDPVGKFRNAFTNHYLF
jgi:xylitol oxidase